MIDQVKAMIAENENPQHCGRDTLREMVKPIMGLTSCAQQQVAIYRRLLMDVEMAPHDAKFDAKFEHVRQTLRAAESRISAFEDMGRDVIQSMAQLDRYLGQTRKDLERMTGEPLSDSPVDVDVAEA